MSTIRLNSIRDIYEALESDLINPSDAIAITCKALKMVDLRIAGETVHKQNVLDQLLVLEKLVEVQYELPIFFGQQSGDFNISEIFD
jgi:hypothetical protein